jgi:PKD repeat protein
VNLNACDSLKEIASYAFGYSSLDSLALPGAAYKEEGIWLSSDGVSYEVGEKIDLENYNSYQIVKKSQALFGFDSISGTVPFVVHFTDSSTNAPTSWFWNFGDGGYSNQANPIHTYNDAGTFTVSLMVSNGVGKDTMIVQDCIQVRDVEPKANFGVDVVEGYRPLKVHFYDSCMNYPTSWYWDFGDGEYSSRSNPIHVYDSVGSYTVSLIVGNTAGFDTLSIVDYISVLMLMPKADFVADSLAGEAPLTVSFTDISLYDPSVWTWSFGDGSTSTEQNPNHTYELAGTYTISLIVSNTIACDSLIMVDYITIKEKDNSGLNDKAMQDIKIYPNPVTSVLTIKVENMKQLQLVNMSGNVLIQEVINDQSIQLDMSAYHQGIYFLILENKDGRIVQKVVRE